MSTRQTGGINQYEGKRRIIIRICERIQNKGEGVLRTQKQGLPLLIPLLQYLLLDLKRVDAAQLQAAEADDVKTVHDEETAFDKRAADRTEPDVVRHPATG